MADDLTIECGYPGGNISVLEVGKTVRVEQEIRDSTSWWFYWNFEVESDTERTVSFDFANGEVVGPWGPAVSHDGRSWSWLGSDSLDGRDGFSYAFDAGERVRFAFSLPYQVADFERYVTENEALAVDTLTTSEGGCDVPVVTLGNPDADANILFTCRHHACESIANYVLEGILEQLGGNAAEFLERYHVHAIPFVDIDGVERGDQGKHRGPHDHNRDYVTGNALTNDIGPIYRSTATIMEYVEDLDLYAAIDVHCPSKWGEGSNCTKFVIRPESGDATVALSQQFAGETHSSDFCHEPEDDEWEDELRWMQPRSPTCANYMQRRSSKLSTTLEIPYFGTPGNVITESSSRALGRNLADALVSWAE